MLAKRLATTDVLSRGRMSLLTVGLGVLPGESAAAGVDFRTRGRRADEAIDVLRLLWGGDAAGVSFQGEFLSLTAACSFPEPHDGRILPSMSADRAWLPPRGRAAAALEYTRWGQIDMTADEVQARASQGVTCLVVSPSSTELAGMQAEISSFADRLGLGT